MPLYEYRCGACGHEFEVIQKLSDRPIRKCESCGGLRAKRVISQTSFVLKGSGWYATEYGGRKAGPSRDKSSGGDGAAKSDTGSDSSSSKSEPSKKAASA